MAKQKKIVIHPPQIGFVKFHIESMTPFLADGIPPGALGKIHPPGSSRRKKPEKPIIKDQTPEEQASDRIAWMQNGKEQIPAIPGNMFQKSMINACRRAPNLTMTEALGLFFVEQELLPFEYEDMKLTMHIGRRPPGPKGVPCEIWRYAFHEWKCELPMVFEETQIDFEMLVHLLNHAGSSIGIGGFRPGKGGIYGRFRVASVDVPEAETTDE